MVIQEQQEFFQRLIEIHGLANSERMYLEEEAEEAEDEEEVQVHQKIVVVRLHMLQMTAKVGHDS